MFGVVRCRGNTDGLTLMMLQYYFQKISLLWQVCNTQGFMMVGKETRGYRATAGNAMRCKVPLPADSVSDVEFLEILNKAASLAKATLRNFGWRAEDMSPFVKKYNAMSELADIAAMYFKIPVPKEDTQTHDPQEDVEDAGAAASKSSAKTLYCATQFKLASSCLAPNEGHVDEHLEALEKACEEHAGEPDGTMSTPSTGGTTLHAMFDCIPALLGDHKAFVRHIADMSREALSLMVLDKHCSMANRRTIITRLAEMSGHTRVSHSPAWSLNDIVFVKGVNRFGRLITTYQKSYNHWLPEMLPADAEKKKAAMEKYDNIKYRVNVELVMPSASQTYGHAVTWEAVRNDRKVLNILSSDALLMPGDHLFPTTLPCGPQPPANTEALFTNCFLLLEHIVKKYTKDVLDIGDERLLGALMCLLGLASSFVKGPAFSKKVLDDTPTAKATMISLRSCPNERVKQGATSFYALMLEARRRSGSLW